MPAETDHTDPADRVVATVMDACAVAVGLGVLAVNRVQAVRRQVQRSQRSETQQEPTSDGSGGRPTDP